VSRSSIHVFSLRFVKVFLCAQRLPLTLARCLYMLLVCLCINSEKLNFFKMFNARSETVASKPIFKRLLSHNRCVVAYDGFYEWLVDEHKEKQPYFVHYSDNRPMLMAARMTQHTTEKHLANLILQQAAVLTHLLLLIVMMMMLQGCIPTLC
jgi:SOS response associated peptidase (SRAP)